MKHLSKLTVVALMLVSPRLGAARNELWSDWFALEGGQALLAATDPDASPSIHLDDGKIASLHIAEVESRDLGHLQGDDFTLTLTTASTRLAVIPLWASYGRFAIATSDLVNGPGDELLIVSLHGRGSPVFEPVLQIWAIGEVKPRQLVEFNVGRFVTQCASWREQVIVVGDSKPRSLRLSRHIESEACPETPEVTAARGIAQRELRYSPADGRFLLVEQGAKPSQ